MSKSRDTIIVRVKLATKRAAIRASKADNLTLTDYIIRLIEADEAMRLQAQERP